MIGKIILLMDWKINKIVFGNNYNGYSFCIIYKCWMWYNVVIIIFSINENLWNIEDLLLWNTYFDMF